MTPTRNFVYYVEKQSRRVGMWRYELHCLARGRIRVRTGGTCNRTANAEEQLTEALPCIGHSSPNHVESCCARVRDRVVYVTVHLVIAQGPRRRPRLLDQLLWHDIHNQRCI